MENNLCFTKTNKSIQRRGTRDLKSGTLTALPKGEDVFLCFLDCFSLLIICLALVDLEWCETNQKADNLLFQYFYFYKEILVVIIRNQENV